MPPEEITHKAMASMAEAQFIIADITGAEPGQLLDPIICTIMPVLMKIAETYGDTHGKLSKTRFHLLNWSFKAVLMLLQSDTEAESLREACAGGGSRFKISDDKLHSDYIAALVELIPSVCDLELQLIAVEVAFNICCRDADAQQLFLKLLASDSNYKPSLAKMFKSFDGDDVESGCHGFVRELHAATRGKYKVRGDKQMNIWDVQAAIDGSTDHIEVSLVLSNEEIYVTNLLTDPKSDDPIDIRWKPAVVQSVSQPDGGRDASSTLILRRTATKTADDEEVITLWFDDDAGCELARRTCENLCPRLKPTSVRRPSVSPVIVSTSSGRTERPMLAMSVAGHCTTPDPSEGTASGGGGNDSSHQSSAAAAVPSPSPRRASISIAPTATVREFDSNAESAADGYDSETQQPTSECEDEEEEQDSFQPNLRQPDGSQSEDDDSLSQQLKSVRNQLEEAPLQTEQEDDDENHAIIDDEEPQLQDESQLQVADNDDEEEDADDFDDVEDIMIGGKKVSELKVTDLKEELTQRLPDEDIPKRWPKKKELATLLEKTIRSQRLEPVDSEADEMDASAGFVTEQFVSSDQEQQPIEAKMEDAVAAVDDDEQAVAGTSNDMDDDETEQQEEEVVADEDAVEVEEDEENGEEDKPAVVPDSVFKIDGQYIKRMKASELKAELQSRLDDSDYQNLGSKPKKALLLSRLEDELQTAYERKQSKKQSKKHKHVQPDVEMKEDGDSSEYSVAADSAPASDDPFSQAVAEYSRENPEEAALSNKKASPLKGKQYGRKQKQKPQAEQASADDGSSSTSTQKTTQGRAKKMPGNTGSLNSLLGDLSENESEKRKQCKSKGKAKGKGKGKGKQAIADVTEMDDDDENATEDPPGTTAAYDGLMAAASKPKSSQKRKAAVVEKKSNPFDDMDVHSDDSAVDEDEEDSSAQLATKKSKRGNSPVVRPSQQDYTGSSSKKKKSKSPASLPRHKSVRGAAKAATAAAAAAAREEVSMSSDDNDEEEQADEIETDEIAESQAFAFDSHNDMDDDEIESDSLPFNPVVADDDDDDSDSGDDDDAMAAFDQDAADTNASSALDAALGLDDSDDDEPEDMIVNGVILNQYQRPSPGVSPMQHTVKKLSSAFYSDSDASMSDSEEELDDGVISGIMDFSEPSSASSDTDFLSGLRQRQSMSSSRHSSASRGGGDSQQVVHSLSQKIKQAGKARRASFKAEAMHESQNAARTLLSVTKTKGDKVEKLRKNCLTPIEKSIKKRTSKIKLAKELLKDQFAQVQNAHKAELATLDSIMSLVRAKVKQADAARQDSAESIQEKQQVSSRDRSPVHHCLTPPTAAYMYLTVSACSSALLARLGCDAELHGRVHLQQQLIHQQVQDPHQGRRQGRRHGEDDEDARVDLE